MNPKRIIITLALLLLTQCSSGESLRVPTEEDIYIYKFPKSEYSFTIQNTKEPKTIKSWSEKFPNTILINGFYFNEDNSPTGMLIIDGEEIHSTTFDFDRSAVLDLTHIPQIIDTSERPTEKWKTAGQSYPILVKNDQPMVEEDSGLIARRTFIGTDSENVYIGLANKNISLYQLAQDLAAMEIHWDMALNLDGGPSSGLFVDLGKDKKLINSISPVPSVIVGERN